MTRRFHVILRWRTADDRGRALRLNSRLELPPDLPLGSSLPLALANHTVVLVMTGCVIAVGLLAASLVAVRTAHLPRAARELATWDTVRQSWLPFVGIVLVAVVVLALGQRMRGRALRECLRLGLCPACGYSLQGTLPAEDSCSPCPECGAAWKLSR